MEVRSAENLMGNNSKPVIIDVHPKRISKGVYGLSGQLIFNDDLTKYFVRGFRQHTCLTIRRTILEMHIVRHRPKYSTAPKATTCTLRRQSILPSLHCAIVSTRIIANS